LVDHSSNCWPPGALQHDCSLARQRPSWRYCGAAGTIGGNLSKARSGADMKVNIEIDCTPLEARQFFGLPDVQPMQIAVMDKLQQQMLANIDKVSPESLIQSWFSFDPKLADRMQDMFVTMTGLGALTADKKK
jgi:Family of unknown function (DUF6489)